MKTTLIAAIHVRSGEVPSRRRARAWKARDPITLLGVGSLRQDALGRSPASIAKMFKERSTPPPLAQPWRPTQASRDRAYVYAD